MKRRQVIEALEAIVAQLKVGEESGQESGPTVPIKEDIYNNIFTKAILGDPSPTTSPTSCVTDSRGSRLPTTWTLGPQGLNYALEKGLSEVDAAHEAEKFKSYWLSASGKQAIKRDWLQCWQTWVLNAMGKYGLKPKSGGQKPKMSEQEIEARIKRYHEQEAAKKRRLGV